MSKKHAFYSIKKFSTPSAIEGAIIGLVSPWYLIFCIACISILWDSKGTKEWAEDVTFLPYFILLWVVILLTELIRRRKDKKS